MKTRMAPLGVLLLLAACSSTAEQLSSQQPSGRWQFRTDLDKTTSCLIGSLNAEWQPKSAASAFFGRSILHSAVAVAPGRQIRIVHEHIGPSDAWTMTVTAAGAGSVAEAFAIQTPVAAEANAKMLSAARACGGA